VPDLASSLRSAHRIDPDEANGEMPNSPLEMATKWLFNSGIYILKLEDQNYGALYSHYSVGSRHHELVYAEATGYGLSLLKYLAGKPSTAPLAEFAKASGNWLVRWAERHHGIIAMGLSRGQEIREAYAFDNGVCCKGLLDLFTLTGDERYLKCAERIADWLVTQALNEDGSVKPVLDLDSGRFVEDRRMWYKVSGSFHAKIAMPLLQLFLINKDRRFRDAAVRIYEWAMGQQQGNGNFPANKMLRATYLHFHCYTVEALLYAYAFERSQRYIDAAERAVNWALRLQRTDSALPRWYGRRLMRETANDVQAQIVRILSLMNMLRPRRGLEEASRKAADSLVKLQRLDKEETTRGGFIGGSIRKYGFIPRKSLEISSWAAMFAIQALHFMEEASTGDFYSGATSLF
jgi:uncharacterized protein YyaL (SSP411 family)